MPQSLIFGAFPAVGEKGGNYAHFSPVAAYTEILAVAKLLDNGETPLHEAGE